MKSPILTKALTFVNNLFKDPHDNAKKDFQWLEDY